MKRVSRILLLCLFLTALSGQQAWCGIRDLKRWIGVSAGAEWGITNTIAEKHHVNFRNTVGMFIDDSGHSWMYHSNGFIMTHVGLEFLDRLELSFYSGYEGINTDRRGVVLAAREAIYPYGCHADGVFVYAEEDFYMLENHLDKQTKGLRLGVGYRFALSPKMNMDFSLAGHLCRDYPTNVMDKFANTKIPASYINESKATYAGISVSAGISF